MNIAVVTHKVIKSDGQGKVNYEVIKSALKRGHSVTIVSSEIDEELLANGNITWYKIKNYLPTAILKYQVFALLSSIILMKHRQEFDVLVVNGFITWLKSDINCVHFVHSSWVKSKYHPFAINKNPRTFYQYIYSAVNAFLEKKSFNKSVKIVAVSNKVKEELVEAGIDNNKIVVINNGVDIEEFCPSVEKQKEKNSGEIKNNKTMFFAGDLRSSRKNLETVLKSMRKVSDVNLFVAGNEKGSLYPKMVKDFGLHNRVNFLGYRRDIANIMREVDLFVFPTRYDPFSLVILEAMASGTPVITSCEAGASNLVYSNTKNAAGIVLDNLEDEEELATAITTILSDSDIYREMSFNGVRIAKDNSWESISNRYIDLMEKIGI